MKRINWGIIGCGDVTEKKSGPAFNLVKDSALIAVMRRNADKARDYAIRHNVPKWYSHADDLINDKEVNAIYVATPPSSHEEYALKAMNAGKPVYIEKPMSVDAASAGRISDAAKNADVKLSVAHYRRGQPYFNEIKKLINAKAIGEVRTVQLNFCKKLFSREELNLPGNKWRVDPVISGGGIFHDLAPHQLDILYYFFGNVSEAKGIAICQSGLYEAADVVMGSMLFKSGIAFNGVWRFNVNAWEEEDVCKVHGTDGTLTFSFFNEQKITTDLKGKREEISFTPPYHVQQPLIEKVVRYFLNEGPNPCSGEEGVAIMELIDAFTKK